MSKNSTPSSTTSKPTHLLAQLRADPELASIPCVAVSANAMDTEVARALSAGFFDYITKPFPFDRIAQLVAKLRA